MVFSIQNETTNKNIPLLTAENNHGDSDPQNSISYIIKLQKKVFYDTDDY
jgi:hypothetical protein